MESKPTKNLSRWWIVWFGSVTFVPVLAAYVENTNVWFLGYYSAWGGKEE